MNFKMKTTLAAGILLASTSVFAGGTQIGSGTVEIKCTMPVSELVVAEMGVTAIDVEVIQLDGQLAGKVNNVMGSRDIKPTEMKIRDLGPIDWDNIDSLDLNAAETRIAHLQTMIKEQLAVPLTFDIKKATSAKLLDLEGDSDQNKFGGTVLMELFDQNGALLGRVLSTLLVGECR